MFHNFQFLNRFIDIPLDQVGQCKLQKFNWLSRMMLTSRLIAGTTFESGAEADIGEICKLPLQKLYSHDMIIYKSLDKATFHCYSYTPGSTGELLLYRKKCIFEGGRPLDKRFYHPKITKQFNKVSDLINPITGNPFPKTRPRNQLPHSKRSCGLGKVDGKCKLSKPNKGRLGCSP